MKILREQMPKSKKKSDSYTKSTPSQSICKKCGTQGHYTKQCPRKPHVAKSSEQVRQGMFNLIVFKKLEKSNYCIGKSLPLQGERAYVNTILLASRTYAYCKDSYMKQRTVIESLKKIF